MYTIDQTNIMFLNLDTVTNVFRWKGQFAARITGAIEESRPGDSVVVQRAGQVIAVGQATEFLSFDPNKDRISTTSVRMDISPLARPAKLSPKQERTLEAVAKQYKCPYPGLQSILAIPDASARCFHSLVQRLSESHTLPALATPEWRLDEHARILARSDISADMKVYLCETLDGTGAIEDRAYERDAYRIDLDDDLDLVATRIVPWEACGDAQRTDPDNYVLRDKNLAEHFSEGMVSFRNTGLQIHDPAVEKVAFDSYIDPSFALPALNKQQKKYMAYHRAHVFKQWRIGTRRRMYVVK